MKIKIILFTFMIMIISFNLASAQGQYPYGGCFGMMSGYYGYGFGFVFSWIIMILIIVALVLLNIWLFRQLNMNKIHNINHKKIGSRRKW